MSSDKLITVFGATGNQGGSVVRSLLKNKGFTVRAITRKPESDAAKDLVSLGAEVVQGSGLNKLEMKAAFSGSWGAFINTNSGDPSVTLPDGPNEYDLGKILIDAAAEAGVSTMVYSSGADTESLTNGQVSCTMMMNKNRTLKYARSRPEFSSVISVDAAWYLDMFLHAEYTALFGGFPIMPDEEGYLTFRIPRWGATPERVPMVAIAEDYGDIVHGVFLDPTTYNGKLIQATSDITSYQNVTETFTKITGKKTRVVLLDELPTYGSSELEDLNKMFRFVQKSNGLYFNGEKSELETARNLKANALKASGSTEDVALTDVERYFRKHFGGEQLRGP